MGAHGNDANGVGVEVEVGRGGSWWWWWVVVVVVVMLVVDEAVMVVLCMLHTPRRYQAFTSYLLLTTGWGINTMCGGPIRFSSPP